MGWQINAKTNQVILVWRFEDAPEAYRELSPHGGDEDWLAYVPSSLCEEYIGWLEYGPFGCYQITEHKVDGGTVKIGAHS